MMILGANLSASAGGLSNWGGGGGGGGADADAAKGEDEALLSNRTMAAIVLGKMVVMPCIGIASAVLLNAFVWDVPQGES